MDTALDELSIFVAVAQAGNLTRAAGQLGLPKSTVSRRLSALEARLGVRLVTRTTQGASATAAGRRLLARVAPALEAVGEALRETVDDDRAVRGRLRISLPAEIGLFHLGRVLRDFVRRHPEVALEVVHTDRQVDLLVEGFDAAVRVGALKDTSVIARPIGDVPGCLVASPKYLRARPAPRTPHDLAEHDCVVFQGPPFGPRWRFTGPKGEVLEVEVQARYASNSLRTLCEAAVEGLGIARVPFYVAADALAAGSLVQVLERWASPKRMAYVVYPATRMVPARVRALIEWIQAHGSQPGAARTKA
jgi:DNA-binding transcriptional LysR family regulator